MSSTVSQTSMICRCEQRLALPCLPTARKEIAREQKNSDTTTGARVCETQHNKCAETLQPQDKASAR